MTGRLLSFLTALSLVLCVAACVLWARSIFVLDTSFRETIEEAGGISTITIWGLDIGRGDVLLRQYRQRVPNASAGYGPGVYWGRETSPLTPERGLIGPASVSHGKRTTTPVPELWDSCGQ
jgi:hypothetical protein